MYYTFYNTCPFDAVVQLMFVAYADSEQYSIFVDKKAAGSTFLQLIKKGVRDGITTQLYRKRALILSTIFQEQVKEKKETTNTPNHLVIDVNSTVNRILMDVFAPFPTMSELKRCTLCGKERNRTDVLLVANLPTPDFTFLSDVLKSSIEEHTRCDFCCKKSH